MSVILEMFWVSVYIGSLNLSFFFGLMSSSGGILGSTSDVVDCNGCGSSVCFSVDVAFLIDGLSFSDLVGFLPGSYSCPMMDVKKNFFLSTWNKSATLVCKAVNFVHNLFWR